MQVGCSDHISSLVDQVLSSITWSQLARSWLPWWRCSFFTTSGAVRPTASSQAGISFNNRPTKTSMKINSREKNQFTSTITTLNAYVGCDLKKGGKQRFGIYCTTETCSGLISQLCKEIENTQTTIQASGFGAASSTHSLSWYEEQCFLSDEYSSFVQMRVALSGAEEFCNKQERLTTIPTGKPTHFS